jgi:DNA-binding XRE family transcriptional regulator
MRPSDLAAVARIRDDLRSGAARKARSAAGVTASEMARVLNVSRTSVSDWETGKRAPSVAHALAYGRALAALAPKAA